MVLTPGQEKRVDVTGSFFFVDSVNGQVDVKFDDGGYSRMISGCEIECAPGDYFQSITFRSPITTGGVTLTVYYYAGTLRIANRFPVVFSRIAPTYAVALRQTIANTATYDIPATNLRTGQPFADNLVRVFIRNFGTPTNLDISFGAGPIWDRLTADGGTRPQETYETADSIRILSNGGGDVGIVAYYNLPT